MGSAKDVILDRVSQDPSAEKGAEIQFPQRFWSLPLDCPEISISSQGSLFMAIQCFKSSNILQGMLSSPQFHV